ncbi:MAG: thiamine pyrophosphate-dependent dehydrogenase E1 component subunit alpha [Alphaproteobacteria bacterium]|nr:thiamine pyrophosphate-dependent dehydrogenase E1 component subunit alpha [Alphaproteobacteria bacterium]MDD9919861.1 thiamine pyrophosphate-dependent dehydrogenase E1 component subunit alpha [Alphaproteobacteria bacterium]
MTQPELVQSLYQTMHLVRRFEEKLVELYPSDKIKSPIHLSIGQEAVAAAVCAPLNQDDIISNTYRCHATHIAKGGNLNAMMAELYGKATGCAGGKAGSMHLVEIESGILGASAVVGTTIPVAAGYALALKNEAKKTGEQRVVTAMFGDGSTEEGCFAETINFAVLHKLPILFVCENNEMAIHNPIERRQAISIQERVKPYGMPMGHVTSGDVFEMHDEVTRLTESVRAGNGPAFIEIETHRWLEHVGPNNDDDAPYRNPADLKKWKENDQVARLAEMLGTEKTAEINAHVEELVAESVTFAEQSAFPTKEELYTHVYA